ncbi:MAG TPA: FmdB family zinc ribbon protein [Candidatus Brocadiaceae bacterium]
MPIYEFQCKQCNTKFDEYFRSSKERKKLFCPSCQGDSIHKVFSVFGMSTGNSSDGSSSSSSGGCGTCTAPTCSGCR